MIADAADGADVADGVVGSVLTRGRYRDGPRSQPPLAAEDDLNPDSAEEGLGAAQPASESAGILWPARAVPNKGVARNIGAGQQKIGSASRPLRSVGHNLTHARRHWVGLDNVLDCLTPVARISGFEGALGTKSRFARCDPEREISHARQ